MQTIPKLRLAFKQMRKQLLTAIHDGGQSAVGQAAQQLVEDKVDDRLKTLYNANANDFGIYVVVVDPHLPSRNPSWDTFYLSTDFILVVLLELQEHLGNWQPEESGGYAGHVDRETLAYISSLPGVKYIWPLLEN